MKPFYSKLLIDEANATNNLQQLCNLKHQTSKKKNGVPTSGNVADEMLNVLQMLNNNKYVQKIEHPKGEIPCIILYSDLQMLDFQKYVEIVPNPRVGIDRKI
jgi:hypothetical protein